jgi:uncharacterized membrane protein
VAHALWYYPQLPDKVASHFGASGQPNAWSTKTFFVAFYLVIIGISVLFFLGISFGISRVPVALINMPNKDYWLSGERRNKTFDFMSQYFLWFGSVTLLMWLDLLHQSFQVHLGKVNSLPHPMLGLGLYIGVTILWIIGLIVKFGKKEESQSARRD